ncbi:hypothetical protein ACI68E_001534 [Malassezia pachydermatis]
MATRQRRAAAPLSYKEEDESDTSDASFELKRESSSSDFTLSEADEPAPQLPPPRLTPPQAVVVPKKRAPSDTETDSDVPLASLVSKRPKPKQKLTRVRGALPDHTSFNVPSRNCMPFTLTWPLFGTT